MSVGNGTTWRRDSQTAVGGHRVYDLRGVRGYDALITRSTSDERHVGHDTLPPLLWSAIDSVLENRAWQARQR
jgi:hypothetical protein